MYRSIGIFEIVRNVFVESVQVLKNTVISSLKIRKKQVTACIFLSFSPSCDHFGWHLAPGE